MDIIKVKSYRSINDVVDKAIDLFFNSDNNSVAFVCYEDTLSVILGILLYGYNFDIGYINIDNSSYRDLYEILIDEDYSVYISPIKEDGDNYRLSNINMRFVDDEVSTRYIRALESNHAKYEVFSVIENGDCEEDISECETEDDIDEIDEKTLHDKDKDDIPVMHIKYVDLSDSEKQLFDLLLDWVL